MSDRKTLKASECTCSRCNKKAEVFLITPDTQKPFCKPCLYITRLQALAKVQTTTTDLKSFLFK